MRFAVNFFFGGGTVTLEEETHPAGLYADKPMTPLGHYGYPLVSNNHPSLPPQDFSPDKTPLTSCSKRIRLVCDRSPPFSTYYMHSVWNNKITTIKGSTGHIINSVTTLCNNEHLHFRFIIIPLHVYQHHF